MSSSSRLAARLRTVLLVLLGLSLAPLAVAQLPTPEQDRAALTQFLTKRFPGVPVADWPQEGALLAPITTAIPLSASSATNVADVIAIGRKRWERALPSGRRLASCFAGHIRSLAASYPQFDAAAGRVVTLESAINHCLTANGDRLLDPSLFEMQAMVAYLRSAGQGQRLSVSVPPAGLPAYASAKDRYTARRGPHNFACASCHVQHAGAVMGNEGLSPLIGHALSWPRVEPGGSLRSLQLQFARCFERMGVVAPQVGADLMDELEYFVSFHSSGQRIGEVVPAR